MFSACAFGVPSPFFRYDICFRKSVGLHSISDLLDCFATEVAHFRAFWWKLDRIYGGSGVTRAGYSDRGVGSNADFRPCLPPLSQMAPPKRPRPRVGVQPAYRNDQGLAIFPEAPLPAPETPGRYRKALL